MVDASADAGNAGRLTPTAEPVDDWYHTIRLPDGPTPGLFDMQSVVDEIPWPEVSGRRCLDVATFDGFWAFELEGRAASEVVAVDIPDFRHVDWLPRRRHRAVDRRTGAGFRHAARALGSDVHRIERNVYDLHPDDVGTFDVVFLGALLLHLRSPFAALEAIRSVTSGTLISVEQCDPFTSLQSRRPLLNIRGSLDWTWTVPNLSGHRRMLEVAGFEVQVQRRSLSPYGAGAAPDVVARARAPKAKLLQRLLRVPTTPGLFTSIVSARPSPDVVPDDDRRERRAVGAPPDAS